MSIANVGLGSYLIIAIVFIGLYLYLIRKLGLYKPKQSPLATAGPSPMVNSLIPTVSQSSPSNGSMTLPDVNEEFIRFNNAEPVDVENLEIMEDDNDNLLLKEAERVVDKIQTVLDRIPIPPDTEDVKSKIKTIVNPYRVFQDTEYYGAINTYIALSLERDLGITLPPEVIEALWN